MCFLSSKQALGNCFLWKSPQASRLNKRKLAFLMCRVPVLEARQPPAGRGSTVAHLSVGASDVEDRWYAMTRDGRQLQRPQRRRWRAWDMGPTPTGVRHGTHIPLLPQLALIWSAHTWTNNCYPYIPFESPIACVTDQGWQLLS